MKARNILDLPSMPLASPSYPRGPYRFIDREYLIVTYESDPEATSDSGGANARSGTIGRA